MTPEGGPGRRMWPSPPHRRRPPPRLPPHTREVNVLAFDAEGPLVHRARAAASPDVVRQVADRLLKLPGVRRKGATAPDALRESS